MRRVLLIIFLGFTGLVLLAAVGLGILLATFNPNSYTGQISAAVEKATGRQLQFQGDIVTSIFPSPSLKTGRLVMNDPGTFGGGAFITVESASVSLAVKPLLQGIIEIEEVSLNAPAVQLVTTAAGRNNWDYGFGSRLPEDVSGARSGGESAQDGSSRSAIPADSDKVVPLTDPAQPDGQKQGYFSRLVVQVERFTCKDGRVLYRDLRTGASYSGSLENLTVESVRQDADIPFAAAGDLTDEMTGRKLQFSLKGAARLAAAGGFSARFDSLDLTAAGLAAEPLTVKNQAEVRYDPARRSLELHGLKGSLDKTGYGGNLALVLPEGGTPAQLTGDLSVSNLNLDEFLGRLTPGSAVPASGSEDVRGAPNLTRPKVAPGGRATAGREVADKLSDQDENAPGKKSGTSPALDGVNGDVTVAITALTLNKIAINKFSFALRAENGLVTVPFSLETLDGTASGTARLDARKGTPTLAVAAAAKGMSMEKLCRALDAKTTVSGALSAEVDVNGRGGSWKEIAPTLKGKSSLLVQKGEVRGFSLIPSNLRGIKDVPTNFPFERISGSGNIERGILTSKDITLQSSLLSGAGGGTVNLVFEQLDLGIDFMVAGQPPAIPVNVTGPFASLSTSVDVRTLMRNTAEGALKSPETARDLLKDAGKLLMR